MDIETKFSIDFDISGIIRIIVIENFVDIVIKFSIGYKLNEQTKILKPAYTQET